MTEQMALHVKVVATWLYCDFAKRNSANANLTLEKQITHECGRARQNVGIVVRRT